MDHTQAFTSSPPFSILN